MTVLAIIAIFFVVLDLVGVLTVLILAGIPLLRAKWKERRGRG